jgi:hypothetical protein
MRDTFVVFLVFTGLVCDARLVAQPVGAGVELGTTLTGALSITNIAPPGLSNFFANQAPFIVGPYLELRLPLQFSVEVAALYNSAPFASNIGITGGSTWQFPLVAKYKLLKGPVRPYIEAGASFSRISSYSSASEDFSHQLNYGYLLRLSNYGPSLGIGAEVKLRFLRISPEIRYTYWALTDIAGPNVPPAAIPLLITGPFHSEHNQVSFLVGFGF